MKRFDPTVIFQRYHSDTEIYHDLMRERVREILLVATLYDSFILQQEGRLSEKIYDDYFKLSLSNAPRITHASSGRDAQKKMEAKKYDLVTLVAGARSLLESRWMLSEVSTLIPVEKPSEPTRHKPGTKSALSATS